MRYPAVTIALLPMQQPSRKIDFPETDIWYPEGKFPPSTYKNGKTFPRLISGNVLKCFTILATLMFHLIDERQKKKTVMVRKLAPSTANQNTAKKNMNTPWD